MALNLIKEILEVRTTLRRRCRGTRLAHVRGVEQQIIGADLVPYNFVGTMETFTADFAHVIHTLFGPDATIEVFAPHRTQASERLRHYYGAEERAIVDELYRDDFAALGYAADLSQLERVRTAWPPPRSR